MESIIQRLYFNDHRCLKTETDALGYLKTTIHPKPALLPRAPKNKLSDLKFSTKNFSRIGYAIACWCVVASCS